MLRKLRAWLVRRIWFVYPATTLLVTLSRPDLYRLIEEAAIPSKDRLHLQEIFVGGRRYQVQAKDGGLTVLTTGNSYWRYTEGLLRVRPRTRSVARLRVAVTELDAGLTRLEMRVNIRMGYLIDVLWIPLFFLLVMTGMPWAWWISVGSVAVLLWLSFSYHHSQAYFQANEMVFFIHKALKDHVVTNLPELSTQADDTLYDRQFASEWERFYRSHSQD